MRKNNFVRKLLVYTVISKKVRGAGNNFPVFLIALSRMIRRTFWQLVFIHIWKGLTSWIASSDIGCLCTSLLSRLSSWLSVTRGNSEVATVRTGTYRSYRSFVWIVPQVVYFPFYCIILIYKSRNIYCICLMSKIARLLGVTQFNLLNLDCQLMHFYIIIIITIY